jgi:hypothetical protein
VSKRKPAPEATVEKKPRGRPGDNISLAPLSVDQALGLLLKTPPPAKDDEKAKRASKKRKGR